MSQFIIIGGDGKEYGPKDEAEIREWIRQGRLNALSQIKEVDDDEWVSLGSRPEFGAAPATSAPPPVIGAMSGASPPSKPIPTYLAQSILVTLCCCIPVGIPAIVYAARIENLIRLGQYAEAEDCSRKAKMWCWIAFGVGIPANIIALIVQFSAEFGGSGF